MEFLIIAFAFILGLIIGSFLNVCIYRIPENKSIAWPGSHCMKCNKPIKWYDNIPVFSFLILGGKCRNCKVKISWQYPAVELLTGLLTAAFVWRYGVSWWTLAGLGAIYSFIILSVIDIKIFIIPDRFSLGLIVWGLAFCWANPNFHGTYLQTLWQSFLGGLVGFGGLFAIALLGLALFRKEAMGGGDIKLMGGVGTLLGWEGVITTVAMACFAGLFYSLYLMINKKAGKGSIIPFGPFLSFGALVNLFFFIHPSMLFIQL
ncbi:leader peptidase (prepilin peptidase)/N-methyltransferase [Elusimicrobium posterum]|uniref:prepilin peptidase n=1 Tax=Elusimicrobium posterum TaxID=3116653 RepID=UPI003C70A20C